MSEPFFSAKCNCLLSTANVNVDGVVGKRIASGAESAVKRHGNWVGGTVRCFEDEVVFSMNALNAKFQKNTTDVAIPYAEMSEARFGSMMWMFKTVDVETAQGLIRFRCIGKSTQGLIDAINSRLA